MPAKDPRSWTESPSADRLQGSSGLPYDPDADSNEPGGDQDIDTAGTEADQDAGDTHSADIVGRTGEQMPLQSHDGLEAEDRNRVRDDDVDTRGEKRS